RAGARRPARACAPAGRTAAAGAGAARSPLFPAQPPDVLHRPAPRPFAIGLIAIGAGGVRRRAQLDQILDREVAVTEDAHPLAVAELEVDRFARSLEAVYVLPVVDEQLFVRMLVLGRP